MGKSLTAVLLVAATSCGGASSSIQVPLPDLSTLDGGLAERVREVHATLVDDLASGPGAAHLWMELGMVYESNELPRLALECYRSAADQYSATATTDSAKVWSRIAQAHHGIGDLEQASTAMRRSIEFEGDYAPSHWRLGTYLFDLGQFGGADDAYRAAIRLDADHLGGWNGIVRVLIQAGEADEAIRVLGDILQKHPKDAASRRLLRTALVHAGRGDEAARLQAPWRRKSALGRDPWHREFRKYRQAPPLMERARADLNSGETGRAVEMLEEFIEDAPHDMNAMSYLAWGYYQLDQKDDAQKTIDRALAFDPTSATVLRIAARIQRSEGDTRGAIEIVERILALDPNDTTTLLEKGALEELRGRSDEARKAYQILLDLDQSNADVWQSKASCELKLELWEEAAASYRAAMRLAPKEQAPVLGFARALALNGEWERAQATLEKNQKLDARGQALLESIKERQL